MARRPLNRASPQLIHMHTNGRVSTRPTRMDPREARLSSVAHPIVGGFGVIRVAAEVGHAGDTGHRQHRHHAAV
jgi:hypothetical protein